VDQRNDDRLPEILTVPQIQRLLDAAQSYAGGSVLPYLVVSLFAGLRPTEARRLAWDRITDRILISGDICKTGRARSVEIDDTLRAWLDACRGQSFCPANFENHLRRVRSLAGIERWPQDVLRHSAISYYWRKTGSFGDTAKRHGNSEAVIRKHYDGNATVEAAAAFWALRPRA
jgi:integrase